MKTTILSIVFSFFLFPDLVYCQHFVVTSNADSGEGSLRAAIDSANTRIGPDSITFQIPGQGESEAGYISLITPLPDITDPDLVIQGTGEDVYTKHGPVSRPDIVIIGNNDPQSTQVCLTVKANNVHISQIEIFGFYGGGIYFDHVMEGSVSGCFITVPGADDEEDKRRLSEGNGVRIQSSSNIFIGPSDVVPYPNVISGFAENGVELLDTSWHNVIIGNFLGILPDSIGGINFGNQRGGITMSSGCQFNEILGNWIGYNGTGINIYASSQNAIIDNRIGVDIEFLHDYGNLGSGIYVFGGASENLILFNSIGYNDGNGIFIAGSTTLQNRISRNAISKNTLAGILNADGGNLELPAPVFQNLVYNSLPGKAGVGQVVEIYFDEGDQGRFYMDSTVADANGDFNIILNEMQGDLNITAIARDAQGNTSEFSAPLESGSQGGVLLVTSTSDGGTGTLREALKMANTNLGPDTIRFNIPKSDPGYDMTQGVWYIKPDSGLTFILDDGLFIDGPSQSNFIGENTNLSGPEIVISGENVGSFVSCMNVHRPGTEIYGLTINNFKGCGISIYSPGSAIISGCFIGTDYSGMQAAGNNDGIVLGYLTSHSFIGPTEYYPFGNVVSGNNRQGIFIVDSSMHNVVVGNHLGTNRDHSDTLGNASRGLDMSRSANYNEIFDNYIGGNGMGVHIYESNYNIIENNFIGTDETGVKDLGHSDAGIFLWNGSSNNVMVNNRIGYNQTYGIYNEGQNTVQNLFSKNTFNNNTYGAIENIKGGNLEIFSPSINSVTVTSISGQSSPHQIIEIYQQEANDPISYVDSVLTDQNGNFSLQWPFAPATQTAVLAIAIDTAGNTSEFSEPVMLATTHIFEHKKYTYLYQNIPNPAIDRTIIEYEVTTSTPVQILLMDSQGMILKELVNAFHLPGRYDLEINVTNLPPGLYFYGIRDRSGNLAARKMVIEST